MLKIVVLGSAAGGGFPQWNCGCEGCRAARANPTLREGQCSVAISADGKHWFLINASPDIRQQINDTPCLHPRGGHLRDSPIAGVILTNGEIDAIAGLLSLREGSPFAIHGHTRVLETLDDNSIFDVLDRTRVPRREIVLDTQFEPDLPDGTPSGLVVEAFEVPGKPAWYLEGGTRGGGDASGDTLGLRIRADRTGPDLFVITACGGVTDSLACRIRGAGMVLFDGTLWTDDELIRGGLHTKTGQRMGHVSVSGADGVIARLADLDIDRKMFVHINNSNPILRPGTPERMSVEAAGWRVPSAGEAFVL